MLSIAGWIVNGNASRSMIFAVFLLFRFPLLPYNTDIYHEPQIKIDNALCSDRSIFGMPRFHKNHRRSELC